MAAPAMGMLSAEENNGSRGEYQKFNRNNIDAILNNSNRGQAAAPVLVRKDFADLLKWSGAIETDADGRAEIPLEFPDNLTTWKARVWTLGKGTQVGEGSAEIITSKDLLVRLQAPRFLVERDEAVLSAVVHNDYDAPKSVKVSLELEGKNLEAIDGAAKTVEIAARAETRVDWRVKALREGEATIRMRAEAGDDGDAVERKLPVLVHGMLRQDAWSRAVEPDQESARILLEVPEQRRPDQSKLTVTILTHHRRCGGRCDSLSGELSPRLHRADFEPLRARRDRPAHAQGPQDQPGRSESQADQSQPAGTRQCRRARGAVATMEA